MRVAANCKLFLSTQACKCMHAAATAAVVYRLNMHHASHVFAVPDELEAAAAAAALDESS